MRNERIVNLANVKVKSKVVCPKCRSNSLILVEWVEAFTEWEQIDGEFTRNDGFNSSGDVTRLRACCSKCNHGWTVRGVLQIDDVLD